MITAKIDIREERKKWDELTKTVESFKHGANNVDIGLFAQQGSDLVEYASKNEFGDPNNTFNGRPAPIPERSFIRSTFDENSEEIVKRIDKAKLDILMGKVNKDTFLKRLGLWFERKVKEKIDHSKEWAVPNAPATIAMKSTSAGRGDQPLVDTGRMKQSITHRLVK